MGLGLYRGDGLRATRHGWNTRKIGTSTLRVYGPRNLAALARRVGLSPRQALECRAVAAVLPFRLNQYVVEELIDWCEIPDDPIFRLTFPQREMLAPRDFEAILALIRDRAPAQLVEATAAAVRARLNPHPGGQRELNVPRFEGRPLAGTQHKYADTLLVFPAEADLPCLLRLLLPLGPVRGAARGALREP